MFRDLMQKSFNIETNSIMSRATVIRHNDLRGLPQVNTSVGLLLSELFFICSVILRVKYAIILK